MDLRRWQRALYWLICLYILGYTVCLLLLRNNGWALPGWEIFFPLGALVIGFVAVFNTYWHVRGRVRNFWMLLFMGLLFSLAGLLLWAYRGLVLDAGHLQAGMPMFLMHTGAVFEVVAIAYLVSLQNSWKDFRYGLEIFIIMTVGIALSWHFIIHPALSQPLASGLNATLTTLYSVIDLGLLLAALGLIYSPSRVLPGKVWPWILGHLVILVAGNSAYLYLAVHNPRSVGIINQPLWALACLLLVPAAFNYLEYNQEKKPEKGSTQIPTREAQADYLRLLLPYAPLILLVLIMFVIDNNINILEVAGVGLLLVIVIKQFYTMNNHKSRLTEMLVQAGELKLQAQLRAEELDRKNAELQSVLEDIQHLAFYDSLTDLPNRRLFIDRLTYSLTRARQNNHMLAVLFIDLDRFKLINDTMGHSFGDHLLREIGQKIKDALRDTDIVSRQGGDEFTVLLDEISSTAEAKRWIEEIQLHIQNSFIIHDIEVQVTASIGVALYPRHGDDLDNLIKYSDIAMYKAKELGKNQYTFYTADMNRVLMRRMSLDRELRSAIQNEELSMYYQPQISIADGKIKGIESLLRWNSVVLGDVSPGELIPVAEENGHITRIGEWVLATSCRQFKNWLDEGYIIPKVAVNISPAQFNDEKLLDYVQRILSETGLDPNYLELEITEGIAMNNEIAVINKLHALKKLGIKVALDDFGTGYSCLSYLSQFPVDTLKIDRSFIHNITSNQDNEILVATIIIMAHNFNIKVVAEGVDTLEQFQMLREKKCDEVQGFLISEPLRSDQLIQLLEKYSDEPNTAAAMG